VTCGDPDISCWIEPCSRELKPRVEAFCSYSVFRARSSRVKTGGTGGREEEDNDGEEAGGALVSGRRWTGGRLNGEWERESGGEGVLSRDAPCGGPPTILNSIPSMRVERRPIIASMRSMASSVELLTSRPSPWPLPSRADDEEDEAAENEKADAPEGEAEAAAKPDADAADER
jgi:hypothetical protein